MNDESLHEPEPPADERRPGARQFGVGTISILLLFFGIIVAMCLGAAIIMALIIFR